ncbi:MAG: bifunctional phosphopantothenoylcysteine decarboxylase/phosphopantothenate--cysteine ligase CoaBC [Firmicutes bacterium]|nr:bifunctional phosphopantothenoylcysteine decarboxylase/phosphopantothenate--cysteine ligase CoaBC [Bacillota bacterium]MBV1726447.1 bifunctional phosphopantothenoylcysteine decarboxylase/phosphopantothenate--cysteine ligase CoaBC [Desulforudis sp.]MBU4532617.1 bifunctional phosphopantothenoylcysteine decarboxylase/phosphopantothenate--cysteine ligase CoaBC [Bacillota bacterium]MBU4554664.1 bifunctional phosphopantothenoylcysteine decarboxylase/phosphopantothenate--cysteine ligase CoaBC [Bacil
MLAGRRVILGVAGGIAAYKAAEIAGTLVKQGVEVRVIMTRAAQEFITPLTLQTITSHEVASDMFTPRSGGVAHIEAARWGEAFLIAPATANIIGKMAAGIGDDLLSTIVLAFDRPVLVCPAMNVTMYKNPVVQRNIQALSALGYYFIEPGSGRLACGEEGPGRLAPTAEIVARLESILGGSGDLGGLKMLITAGPTREPLDSVRYISNRSSGKMGYAVAKAAAERGADVVLVSGPVALSPPDGVNVVFVETAQEMHLAVNRHFEWCDVVVKAAAVADYRVQAQPGKIKKGATPLTLTLEPNPDILRDLGERKGRRVIIGFAAETEQLETRAVEKARNKGADLIVANDVTRPGAGFDVDTNIAVFAYPDGRTVPLPLMTKSALAHRILDQVLDLREDGADNG